MKESKNTLQRVVFQETVVKEYVYEFLAESHEEAVKILADNNTTTCIQSENKLLSREIIEIK